MAFEKKYMGFAIFIGIIFSIVLFTDRSVEKIDILDTTNLTTSKVELYKQTVSAEEWEKHCQIGQLFIDGKYIEKDYETAFFHLFLCEKTYSWTSGGRGQNPGGKLGTDYMHTTFKQFIPVFKSNNIKIKMQSARNNALTHAKSSNLSFFELGKVKGRIERSFERAVVTQKRVSSGMTYRDLIILTFVMLFFFSLYYSALME